MVGSATASSNADHGDSTPPNGLRRLAVGMGIAVSSHADQGGLQQLHSLHDLVVGGLRGETRRHIGHQWLSCCCLASEELHVSPQLRRCIILVWLTAVPGWVAAIQLQLTLAGCNGSQLTSSPRSMTSVSWPSRPPLEAAIMRFTSASGDGEGEAEGDQQGEFTMAARQSCASPLHWRAMQVRQGSGSAAQGQTQFTPAARLQQLPTTRTTAAPWRGMAKPHGRDRLVQPSSLCS